MHIKKVKSILLPCRKDMPINYTVTPEDKLIYAVELMLEKNIKSVSVVRSGRPIGMVRLEDALKKLGLNVDFLKYNINV